MNRRRERDDPRRGEVWSADLGDAAKVRPVIILSRNDSDRPRRLTVYIPVTKQNCGSRYEVELPRLPFLDQGSTANAQGIASGESADEDLFIRKLGDVPPEVLTQVEEALRFTVGLDATT